MQKKAGKAKHKVRKAVVLNKPPATITTSAHTQHQHQHQKKGSYGGLCWGFTATTIGVGLFLILVILLNLPAFAKVFRPEGGECFSELVII
jgi:hypothetical protein